MADYNATARSNYFRVRDLDAFKTDLARHGLDPGDWEGFHGLVLDTDATNAPAGAVALFSRGDHGTWPSLENEEHLKSQLEEVACNAYEPLTDDGRVPGESYDEDDLPCDACHEAKADHTDTTPYARDISELVSRHLIDGDVAVLMEAGAEKARFIGGSAVAVNNKGEVASVDLDDIYAKAADMGATITHASY